MRRLKNIFNLIFILVLPGTLSSQKAERITMLYQETVCPPQWISYDNSNQTIVNLKELLLKDSIEVFSVKFTGKLYEMTCAGCQCLTGRNIDITIDRVDQKKAEALRFNRPWIWMDKTERVCDWTMGLFDDEINDSLVIKGIRLQGLYCTGLSEKKNENCSTQSGRYITIRVDQDDMDKAQKEGFVWNRNFKQY